MLYRTAIKDMPKDQRPRERLLREGPAALTDAELLAIMLRTGTPEASALELAAHIISVFGGLTQLVRAGVEELSSIKGIGPAKAAQVKAAMELGRRAALSRAGEKPRVSSPEDAALLVMEEMRHLDREHFCALFLNTKNQVIAREKISVGTLNSSTVHPRELFKGAVLKSAAALILVHNHPSGDPTPSREDLEVTRRLREAGEIMGIEVLDHIIIGDNKFTSLKAKGMF